MRAHVTDVLFNNQVASETVSDLNKDLNESEDTAEADDLTVLETVVELLKAPEDTRASWVGEALCGGKTHLFFAPPGERRTRRTKREALAMSYCLQCPVMDQCRSWARENRESGFWGGENEEQRAAAGFAPKSPNRRAVADAARIARKSA